MTGRYLRSLILLLISIIKHLQLQITRDNLHYKKNCNLLCSILLIQYQTSLDVFFVLNQYNSIDLNIQAEWTKIEQVSSKLIISIHD